MGSLRREIHVKTNKRLRTRVAVAGVVALLGASAAAGTQYLASANAAETKAVFRPIAGRVPAAPNPAPTAVSANRLAPVGA